MVAAVKICLLYCMSGHVICHRWQWVAYSLFALQEFIIISYTQPRECFLLIEQEVLVSRIHYLI